MSGLDGGLCGGPGGGLCGGSGGGPVGSSDIGAAPGSAAQRPVPPLLVIAVGNPSRGDDALGPALVQALQGALARQDEPAGAHGTLECLVDFQLQVEHVLDLAGRHAVLFVDAALPPAALGAAKPVATAAGTPAAPGAVLETIAACDGDPPMSHALRPQALLAVARRVLGQAPPPSWQLAITGERFVLGDGLSATAQANLALALVLARQWLAGQRLSLPAPRA